MVYSGTVAFHALVILCDAGANPEVYDLDIFAILYICVIGALFSTPMLQSKVFNNSNARSIINLWTAFLVLGTIVCFILELTFFTVILH